MNNEKAETGIDELDAVIAAALGDESAWPVPRGGFEERCTARVDAILKESKTKHALWPFGRIPALVKIAASFVAMLAFASILFNIVMVPERECADGELQAMSDFGSQCESTVRLLEREVSRKAATEFLAGICMAGGL